MSNSTAVAIIGAVVLGWVAPSIFTALVAGGIWGLGVWVVASMIRRIEEADMRVEVERIERSLDARRDPGASPQDDDSSTHSGCVEHDEGDKGPLGAPDPELMKHSQALRNIYAERQRIGQVD